jgi:hypothetical protein
MRLQSLVRAHALSFPTIALDGFQQTLPYFPGPAQKYVSMPAGLLHRQGIPKRERRVLTPHTQDRSINSKACLDLLRLRSLRKR